MQSYPEPYECLSAKVLQQEKEVKMQGWMKKKSGREKLTLSAVGNYDKRYFIILKGWVYYYKDITSEKPQGIFSLQGYSSRVTCAEEERSISLPHVFKVFPKSHVGRTWYFAPDSKVAMDQWIEAFKVEIDKYNVYLGNLRQSVSLPSKIRTSPGAPYSSGRPQSMNNRLNQPHRTNDGKNSLGSSQSTISGGSMSSLPLDDLDYTDEGNYEDYDRPPEPIDEANYITDDEIISVPQRMGYPGDVVSPNHNSPSLYSPNSHVGMPLPPIPRDDIHNPQVKKNPEMLYDEIDDKLFQRRNAFDFRQSPYGAPLSPPPPGPKPNFISPHQRKEPLSRIDSIPQNRPPLPPVMLPSAEAYEKPDPAIIRPRATTLQEKPLPALPQERINGWDPRTQSLNEMQDVNSNDSPLFYSQMPEGDVYPSIPEEDAEQTYDDTIVRDDSYPRSNSFISKNKNQFSTQAPPTPLKPYAKKPTCLPLKNNVENKSGFPTSKNILQSVQLQPSAHTQPLRAAGVVSPEKPAVSLRPSPKTTLPQKKTSPFKPSTPIKPGTALKPPPTPLKPKKADKPYNSNQTVSTSNKPKSPSSTLDNKEVKDNSLIKLQLSKPLVPTSAVPSSKNLTNKISSKSFNYEVFPKGQTSESNTSSSGMSELDKRLAKQVEKITLAKELTPSNSKQGAMPNAGKGNATSSSNVSSNGVLTKAKMFGGNTFAKPEPDAKSANVLAKAKMFDKS